MSITKPVAEDDFASFFVGDVIGGNLLSNDAAGSNGNKFLRAFDGESVDGKKAAAVTTIEGTYGTFYVKPDGSYTYEVHDSFKAELLAGQNLVENVSYKISDGAGNTDVGRLTLEIKGQSQKPVAVDDDFSFSESSAIGGNVLANDLPGENGQVYLRSVAGSHIDAKGSADPITDVAGAYGTFHFKPDGTFTYDLNPEVKASLGEGENVTETLRYYKISDGAGNTDVGVIKLTINGEGVTTTNTPPVALADAINVSEDGTTGVPASVLLANDIDADGDGLIIQSINGSGSNGTVSLVDGDVRYTAGAAYQYLQAGETANDSFSYTVSDGKGGTSTANVTVTVLGANDGPTASDDSGFVKAGSSIDINVLGNDTDPEGDLLTIVSVGAASHGTVSINPDGTLKYTAGTDFTGSDTFAYTVADEFGATSEATVSLVIGTSDNVTVGGDVFLQGNFMEIGVSSSGSLGTENDAPEGFHPQGFPNISYVVDEDGWDSGEAPDAGDFTLPGSPVDTIVLGIDGSSYVQDERSGERSIDTVTVDVSSGDTLAAQTTGTVAGVEFTQLIELDADATYYKTTITLTNTTGSDLSDVRFLRSFDPDQDIAFYGTYQTFNDLLSNPTEGNDIAVARATGVISGVSVNLVSFDEEARVSNYGFANYDAYDSALFENPVDRNGTSVDEAITLTFKIDTLAANTTVTKVFYTSLNGSRNANDMTIGTDGADTLNSREGDDILIGLAGDDTLTGGAGNDTFIVSRGSGADTILDFVSGANTDDVIELRGFGLTSLAAVKAVSSETAGNLFIDLGGGDSITLVNTALASIHQDDFTFFA